MISQRLRNKDTLGAGLLILIGLAVVFIGRRYHTGTLMSMGAGFFPTVMGTALVAVGFLIGITASPMLTAAQSTTAPPEPSAFEPRAWGCIIGGVVAFVVLGTYGGFIPAAFVCVFISALGDRQNSPRDAGLLAALIVVAGYLIFRVGLKLDLEPFSWG